DALEGVTEEDLTIARKRREVSMALTLEGTSLLAPQLASWWSSAGLDYYLGYDARMAAQTVDDLRRFARAYIVGRPRVIGVLAPPETTEQVAAALRRGVAGARGAPGGGPSRVGPSPPALGGRRGG